MAFSTVLVAHCGVAGSKLKLSANPVEESPAAALFIECPMVAVNPGRCCARAQGEGQHPGGRRCPRNSLPWFKLFSAEISRTP